MKIENLETAARFAQKRRELSNLYELLTDYTSAAEVTVSVPGTIHEATIKSDTFNALMVKLVESEIANIDKFVEQL